MFALVRMHVPLVVQDRKTGVSRQVTSGVWDYVMKNHQKWRTKHVRPLFLTHREDRKSVV